MHTIARCLLLKCEFPEEINSCIFLVPYLLPSSRPPPLRTYIDTINERRLTDNLTGPIQRASYPGNRCTSGGQERQADPTPTELCTADRAKGRITRPPSRPEAAGTPSACPPRR